MTSAAIFSLSLLLLFGRARALPMRLEPTVAEGTHILGSEFDTEDTLHDPIGVEPSSPDAARRHLLSADDLNVPLPVDDWWWSPEDDKFRGLLSSTATGDSDFDDGTPDDWFNNYKRPWSREGADASTGSSGDARSLTNDDWYRIHFDDDFSGLPRGDDFLLRNLRGSEEESSPSITSAIEGSEGARQDDPVVEKRQLTAASFTVERAAGGDAAAAPGRLLRGRRSLRELLPTKE